jgi:hypothetical protein
MRTVFSGKRKHLWRDTYYIRVYDVDGIYRYSAHYSREERERFEQIALENSQRDVPFKAWGSPREAISIYRINVIKKPSWQGHRQEGKSASQLGQMLADKVKRIRN